ncbi:hypothetical protein [Labrenzia sp. OB1]|uniref:hypothetical protein n=1 Tax=Labrenzia sp. OB1 TaxID=1561204 RepID=UPI000838299A|nr:hypothetical protein [Labrenzia sp. OB1]
MSITLRNLLIAGLVAEIAFEAYAWFFSPLLFGVVLQPANLIVALANIGLGITLPYWMGFLVHFCVGAIGFSAFVLLTHMATRLNLVLAGAVAGVVLWFVAQGLLAPLVGRTFMMGFGAYTQSSLVGHVGMTLIAGIVLYKLRPAETRDLTEGLGGTA